MPDRLAFVLDAPTQLPADELPTSRIQIAKQGSRFTDPRYGKFAITQDDFDAWKRTFSLPHFQDGIPIDADHELEKGGSSRAAGWIKSLAQEGKELWATVEWSRPGAEAVRGKEYRFISPAFRTFTDDEGRKHPNTLTSVALTNRPFLGGMAAITLSREPLTAQVDPEQPPAPADSRPAMDLTPKILEALGVEEDADEAKVLEAIEAQKTPAEPKPDEDKRSLEQHASEEGKVVLDADKVQTLLADAKSGKDAADKLHERDFKDAFTLARTGGKLDAKPETETLWRETYDINPEQALKLLAALPTVVNTQARGSGGSEDIVDTPEGVDPERAAQDRKAQAYMLEHKTDYLTALEAVG